MVGEAEVQPVMERASGIQKRKSTFHLRGKDAECVWCSCPRDEVASTPKPGPLSPWPAAQSQDEGREVAGPRSSVVATLVRCWDAHLVSWFEN